MQLMIPAISIKAALSGLEALGLDSVALLAAIDLDQADLENPFASAPNDRFGRLWAAAFTQRPDPTLPTQAGFAVPFSEFGLLDHLVTSAATIGEGLHSLNLFLWLVATNLSLHFTHDRGDWVWVENDPPEPTRFISEQWTLAIIVQRFRTQMPPFAIEAVHLVQAADGAEARFTELWGAPVRLGQARSGIRLADGVWEQSNAQADSLLQRTLRTVAEQAEMKQLVEAPLIYAIRTRLPEALQRDAYAAEDIAAELGLSKRTLQRHLSAENVTFKELLDLYRQEQAMLMLQRGDRDMANIAYELGYNEQSSFSRAFRRWTGQSPSQWLTAHTA